MEKTPDGEFVIVMMDSQLGNPFGNMSVPLSRTDATDALRKINVPESDIATLFARAEKTHD